MVLPSSSSDHTFCSKLTVVQSPSPTAIKPPVALAETGYSQPSTYTIDGDGNNREKRKYTVHEGAQFGVECSSVASETEEFPGIVTWYRKTASGLLYTLLHNFVYIYFKYFRGCFTK